MKTVIFRYVFISLIFLNFINTSNAQTYTFETCGATGRFGPTQGQVNATYTGANTLTGAVTINTQGIQEWTVPFNGIYRITVIGAAGGGSTNTGYGGGPDVGGRGARMVGDFTLTAGTVLKVLVGQMGPSVNCTPGGGGGSYVATITNTPLIVGGGGGGASSDYDGIDAVVTTTGTTNTANTAPGGVGGNGGGSCQLGSQHNGGGGGGFFGNGQNGLNNACGGISFVNGGTGGDMNFNTQAGGYGGFGGGGGSSYCTVGGGGGGGYSGGAGGEHYNNCGPNDNLRSAGGGGGSFNSGTNQVNTTGVGTGMGSVIITQLCPSTAPTLTCPSNITVNNDAGNCSAVVTYTTPTNGCATVTQTAGLPSGSAFPVGTTTNTYQATNAFGTVTCSFTVTVVDAENPVVTCPADITINTDAGQCTSTAAIGTATGTDNCGVPTITSNAPVSFPIGNTTVIWTATDGVGNIDTCHQIVTVVDAENPVITCPGNITVGNDPNQCSAVVTYTTPVGTDNCTGAVTTLTSGLASGSTFPVGTTTVTYTVTDGSNNVDSCSFTVTVADSVAPTALCKDFTLYLDAFGTATLIADSIDGGSTDDCAIDTLTLSQDVFTCSNLDSNNVTLYVTDAYGNVDSCTATVTVLDTVAPSVLCQDITLYLDTAGNVTLIADSIDGGSMDNCAIDSFSVSQSVFTCSEIGANNVMLYVTDSSGNIDSCTAIVTVLDTIPPTVVCPSDQTVETDVTCMYEILDYTSLATSLMDNCDMNNLIITQDPAAGTMVTAENISNNAGQTMVTIIVQDMSGNIDSCDFVIDVECSDELEIPNVFTPNGDGTNDVWNLNGIDEYPDAIVQVFNRWGDVVFESSVGYTDPWDGTYNGTDVPVATYYYIIKLSSSEEGITGTINIVR